MNLPTVLRLPQRGPSRDSAVASPTHAARRDIQGLRAVAVLLVIGHHVAGWPHGGFVGVDVFFVISGFLITGLLIKERERTGRTSLAEFYRRRVRRIVPMATVVLAVTVVGSFLIFGDARGQGVATDAGWAFAFVANWHFAHVGADYFAAYGPASPLQHYWSLSVEEQFYVVWPVLLIVGGAVLARRGRPSSGRRFLGIAAVVVVVLSFTYSWFHSTSAPTDAYFSTLDRAWELALGALLAVGATRLTGIPTWARSAGAWAGLVLIGVGVVVAGTGMAFPAPGAVLPVLGAALVLGAGVGGPAPLLAPLTNPVMRYLGDISYSLYLWHLPVLVLGAAYAPQGGVVFEVLVVLITLALASLSYHLVEDPVRRSSWLEPRWRRALTSGPANHSHRVANGWIVTGAALAALLTVVALRPPQAAPEADILTATPSMSDPGAPGIGAGTPVEDDPETPVSEAEPGEATGYLQQRIVQSLGFEEFPRLDPPVDALPALIAETSAGIDGCGLITEDNLESCSSGKADGGKILVIGDSFGIAYMPALREAMDPYARVIQLTKPECPPFDAETLRFNGSRFPDCAEFKQWTRTVIDRIDPQVIFYVSSYVYPKTSMASGATGLDGVDEVADGWNTVLDEVSKPGRFVTLLAPPPGSGNLQACFSAVASPRDCEAQITPEWYDFTDMERDVAAAHGAEYIDSQDWFCNEGLCPAVVGSTPVFVDGAHVTSRYAREIAPAVLEGIAAAVDRYKAAFAEQQTPEAG